MKLRATLCILLLAAASACTTTPPQVVRIDGSTNESFSRTWSALLQSLDNQERAELNGSLILLLAANRAKIAQRVGSTSAVGPGDLKDDLNGKSFSEIIVMGNSTGARITRINGKPIEK